MKKIILPLILVLTFSSFVSAQNSDLESYVKFLSKKAKDWIEYLSTAKNQTNNTQVIETIETDGIDNFAQSAQVMKLTGIKDSVLSAFVDRFVGRLNFPPEYKQNLTEELTKIGSIENKDWKSYKFIYSKNDLNSTCYYMSILAQHDLTEKKSNWIYTEVNTKFNKTDMFVISKTEIQGSKFVETVEFVSKPADFNENDLELVMKFYEVIAVKTFGNYLGIKDDQTKNFLQLKLLDN